MKHSRRSLFIWCIGGVFLTVYGTAVILRLMSGDFLLDGGLTDLNYVLLALLCAVPFLFYLVVSKNDLEKISGVIFTSGFFFLLLFIYTNFILVFSLTEHSQAIAVRLLITFPIVALIMVAVLHFIQSRNIWWRELN
ncbi:MAG: hypothetical protein ABS920_03460 [Sporosarcina sp.]